MLRVGRLLRRVRPTVGERESVPMLPPVGRRGMLRRRDAELSNPNHACELTSLACPDPACRGLVGRGVAGFVTGLKAGCSAEGVSEKRRL